jgi:hypothetical protein
MFALVLIASPLCPQTNQESALTQLISKASFVFRGTVRELHASTPSIPTEERTAIVHVDEVIDASADMPGYNGKDVTVRLLNPEATPKGSQRTFFTEPYSFGHTTGVNEIASQPVQERAALARDIQAARQKLADNAFAKQLASAELVVVATVGEVGQPEGDRKHELESEHNPLWLPAILRVEKVLKGQPTTTARVFFASSKDVMWVRSPKLKREQQGIFLIRRFELPYFPPPGFVVVDPVDFQDLQQLDRVVRLLGIKP